MNGHMFVCFHFRYVCYHLWPAGGGAALWFRLAVLNLYLRVQRLLSLEKTLTKEATRLPVSFVSVFLRSVADKVHVIQLMTLTLCSRNYIQPSNIFWDYFTFEETDCQELTLARIMEALCDLHCFTFYRSFTNKLTNLLSPNRPTRT